jgi:hypothetical protein
MNALMAEGEALGDLPQRTARRVEAANAVVEVDARSLGLVLVVQESRAGLLGGLHKALV